MERNCEDYAMAATARSEGIAARIPDAELDRHLAGCRVCRAELNELAKLNSRFAAVQRATVSNDVWPRVSERILPRRRLRGYLLLGALLGTVKCFEVFTGYELPLSVEFMLGLVSVAVLFLSREQLFRIVSELPVEGETL
jgi:predicted anti-sigma-YlaC factor YlaD